MRIEHESGLSPKEWRARQAEKQRVEELEAQLQSQPYTPAEIDALIYASPLWDADKRQLREKYLGKLKVAHESELSDREWVRHLAEKQRAEALEARLESRHYTQAEIDHLIRTTQMGDEEKNRLRKKYLGKR